MVDENAGTDSFAVRHHFLIRRLHSLAGLVPVGVFLTFHLLLNSTIVVGPEAFQFGVDQIHRIEALGILKLVEVFGIFIPLAFHAILGVKIWLSGEPNAMAYRDGSNIRYTLQRLTGVAAFLFIMLHLWQMHWLGAPFGGGFFDPQYAAVSAAEVMKPTWVGLVYAVGTLCAVFHFANGIWTSLITWGITVGPRSQRIAGYACTAFGIMLGLAGLAAVRGFKTLEMEPFPAETQASTAVVDHEMGLTE